MSFLFVFFLFSLFHSGCIRRHFALNEKENELVSWFHPVGVYIYKYKPAAASNDELENFISRCVWY